MKQNILKQLIKLTDCLQQGAHEYYRGAGLQYVDVPTMVGITGACENVDTLFRVDNRLGVPLFFTQTGQLTLEQALQYYSGVYTMIYSGRDEETEDERHIRQFRLTEEEFDWTLVGKNQRYDEEKMYEALLQHIEKAVKHIAHRMIEDHGTILQDWGRDVQLLKASLEEPFLRVSYEEAVRLLQHTGRNIQWGDDLKAKDEAIVVDVLNKKSTQYAVDLPEKPVFIMRYPKEIKFFNMKQSESDPRVVLSADLIFPLAGEGVGSAVREHDGVKLKQRLITSPMFQILKGRGISYENFAWYTEGLVASGKTQPHAGYGLGNERLLQYLLGQTDIRHCSLFSWIAEQTGDWRAQPQKIFQKTYAAV